MLMFIGITAIAILLVFLWCACKTNGNISREEESEMLKYENENSRK
jgi:hypothetical protein